MVAVNEVSMAQGQWSLRLRPDTPRFVTDQLDYFGHVAITTGRVNPAAVGDGLLKAARYVGVLTGKTLADPATPKSISGAGMTYWLGDQDDKGSVFETAVNLSAASFHTAIGSLLPSSGAVTAGFISTSVPGTITQSYQWVSPRTAITGVCSLMSGSGVNAAEFRVNGDGTIDAGLVSELFVTTPVAAITRRSAGPDARVRALRGVLQNASDVIDYGTRAVVLAGSTPTAGSANAASVPYRDVHGNTVKITRVVSQPSTAAGNATAAAAAVLAQYGAPRNGLTLSTDEYDMRGTVAVGDYLWLYDPDAGLVDTTQEVRLRGELINPVLARCAQLSWPYLDGYGAAYRDKNGTWTDLTDYVVAESGSTSVVVGATARLLV